MNTHIQRMRQAAMPLLAGMSAMMATTPALTAGPERADIPPGMTASQLEAAERIPSLKSLQVDQARIPLQVRGELGLFEAKAGTPDAQAAVFLEKMRSLFRADGSEELRLYKASKDAARDTTHYRFEQTIDGIEVIGGEVKLHVEDATSRIISMEAQFLPGAGLPRKPLLMGGTVQANVLSAMNARDVEQLSPPRLVFARSPAATGHLVWACRVSYLDSTGRRQKDELLIDAITGELVQRLPEIFDALDREVRDVNTTAVLLREPGGSTTDQAALDVWRYSADTYNYFLTFFGRDSPFGDGRLMIAYVHGTPLGQINAVFNHRDNAVYFGDGDGSTYGPFSAGPDVVAHEWTHAITWTDIRLSGVGETGALNESLSDMFGAAVERWAGSGGMGDTTWFFGDQVYTPSTYFDGMRYMHNPTLDGHSLDWYPALQPTTEVHDGAGIGNLAFKLMAVGGGHPRYLTKDLMPGMGFEHAARVVYLALPHLLSNSTYPFAADRMIEAAEAEFGHASIEHGNTCRAWKAVGVPLSSANAASCQPPDPPSSVSLDLSTCAGRFSGITVSWSAVPGATYYTVYDTNRSVTPPQVSTHTYSGTSGKPSSSGSNRTHFLNVAACSALGCGPASGTVQGNCSE